MDPTKKHLVTSFGFWRMSEDALPDANTLSIASPEAPWSAPGVPGVGEVGVIVLADSETAPSQIEICTYSGVTGTGPYMLTGVSRGQGGTQAARWMAGALVGSDVCGSLSALWEAERLASSLHRADSGNPHGTTAAQSGAAPASHVASGGNAHSSATQSNSGFMSAADKLALDSHVGAGGAAHPVATPSAAGFMSAVDKQKLDGLNSGSMPAMIVGNIESPMLSIPCVRDITAHIGGGVTFARATTATYVDRYGVLQSAAIDAPRINHLGLLLEGSSTNLLTYSADFAQPAWLKDGTTVGAQATAPDGTATAYKILETATTAIHRVWRTQVINAGAAFTYSVYAKAAERNWIQVILYTGTGGAIYWANVDLSTGAVGHTTGGFAPMVEPAANGWWRIGVFGPGGTGTSGNIQIAILQSNANLLTPTTTGVATSGVYLWGCQLEETGTGNSAVPVGLMSSYIPTTTTTVTRGADYLSIAAASMPSHGAPFTAMLDFVSVGMAGAAAGSRFFRAYSTTQLYATANGVAAYYNGQSGTIVATIFDRGRHRLGMRLESGGFVSAACDGVVAKSGQAASILSAAQPLGDFSNGQNALMPWGFIRNIRLWDVALSDAEMMVA